MPLYYTGMNEARDLRPERLTLQLLGSLHGVEERLETALDPLGLSLAKLKTLAELVSSGEPLPLRTLAERSACVRSNITQLIDRLEADGLVRRVDDPRDRRSVRAELTAEGRSRHTAGMRALQKAERELLKHLSPKQQEDLLQLLELLENGD